ncbi:Tn3 family transposase [Streptomyces anulatus]|uniref:Transposase n=1 Tax=Streptomyces anulatus TaxID=1892 RepID=A0ABZ1ZXH5_STRAQ|nr:MULTISPECIES: Tn3 family transposase [Streptomyces]
MDHVDRYHLGADTTAALIETAARVPVAEFWGKGLMASADGSRFVVPTRTPSSKCFAKEKGTTWLNAFNDGQTVMTRPPVNPCSSLTRLLALGAKELAHTRNSKLLSSITQARTALRDRPTRQG